jgi:hypothetical protein
MRRAHCIVLLAALLAITPVLAGCAGSHDDKLDIFNLNEKKKLKGERKELFPEGVPGVTQGLPPEYLKNTQPQPDTAQMPPALPASPASAPSPGAPADKAAVPTQPDKTAAVAPVEEPKPKPKPKHKPKPRTAKHPVAQPAAQPAAQKQTGSQQQPPPWPDQQQAQSPGPAPAPSTGASPWPSAPPPGTFSR